MHRDADPSGGSGLMATVQPFMPLPRQSTRYIGRDDAVRDVAALLESQRLVTLTGTGGIGKTRLALEVAATAYSRFPAGVFVVELARTSDPEAVPALVAGALGVQLRADDDLPRMVANIVHQPLLLILDNCEHLIEACASVAQHLIEGTRWVSILATSRESLAILGEQLLPISRLTVPSKMLSDVRALMATESVELFVDRAQMRNPLFQLTPDNAPAIRDICRRLDGIPLAIELAAAHVRTLSPVDILARLNDRLTLPK